MKKIILTVILALLFAACGQVKKAPAAAATPVPGLDMHEVATELSTYLPGHWAGQSNHFYFNGDKTFRTTFSNKPWTYGKWMIIGVNEPDEMIMIILYGQRPTVEAEAVLKTVPGYSKTGEGISQEVFWFHFSEDKQEIIVYDQGDKIIKDNLSFVGDIKTK